MVDGLDEGEVQDVNSELRKREAVDRHMPWVVGVTGRHDNQIEARRGYGKSYAQLERVLASSKIS